MARENQFQHDAESKADGQDRSQQINNSSTELASSIWDGMRVDGTSRAGSDLQSQKPARLTIEEGTGDNNNTSFNLRTREQAPALLPQVDFYDSQSK